MFKFQNFKVKERLLYPPVDKDGELPRVIDEPTIFGDTGAYSVEIVEYSEKFVVVFGPPDLATRFSANVNSNSYTHPTGKKIKGYGLAKSSKHITEFKSLTSTDFESLYKFPVSKSYATSSASAVSYPPNILASPAIQNTFTPGIPMGTKVSTNEMKNSLPKTTLETDIILLFTKISNMKGVEQKEALGYNIVYGEADKVDTVISTFSTFTVKGQFLIGEPVQKKIVILTFDSMVDL